MISSVTRFESLWLVHSLSFSIVVLSACPGMLGPQDDIEPDLPRDRPATMDAGSTADAGTTTHTDSGQPPVDGGTLTEDGGSVSVDAGALEGDAGPSGQPPVDGGSPGEEEEEGWMPGANALVQDTLFLCEEPGGSSPARLRRVNRIEWTHMVGKPMSGTWWGSVAKDNPFDAPERFQYSTYSEDVSIDATTLDLYFSVLPEAGAGWTAKSGGSGGIRTYTVYTDNELNCIFNDDSPSEECVIYYVHKLLRKGVLFHSPSSDEIDRLFVFALSSLALEESSEISRHDTLSRITQAAWLTSAALFKRELGDGNEDIPGDGRYRLSDAELVRALGGVLSTYPPGASGVSDFGGGPPEHPNYTAPPEGHLADIAAAGEDGSIQDPAILEALIEQYFGGIDPHRFDLQTEFEPEEQNVRGEYWLASRISDFFREWFDYDQVESIFKDGPRITSQWHDGYVSQSNDTITSSYNNLLSGRYGDEPLLKQQLDDTIARVVIEDVDVFEQLLSTRMWRVASNSVGLSNTPCTSNNDCASNQSCSEQGVCAWQLWKSTINTHRPYNLSENVPYTAEGRWISMPPAERAGVLTHPAWLAAHGGNFEDDASLVHRGKWIRENLFCEVVPPLELVMVEAQLVPSHIEKSARDRVMESIETGPEAATCMGCHSSMNSLGYPFEIYNHAGFLRYEDHGGAPDGTSEITNAPDPSINGSITDAVDLSLRLSTSDHVKRCAIRQTFRFFMGREETYADACTLSAMETAYDASGSFKNMLKALVKSDTFLYRHHEEGGSQ